MPVIPGIGSSPRPPRTVLSFFHTALWVDGVGSVGLASSVTASGQIAFAEVVAVVGFVTFLGILIAVFLRSGSDPSKLMLTEMTGPEFSDYQRQQLGDSTSTRVVQETEDATAGHKQLSEGNA
jgi:hypothetical protein